MYRQILYPSICMRRGQISVFLHPHHLYSLLTSHLLRSLGTMPFLLIVLQSWFLIEIEAHPAPLDPFLPIPISFGITSAVLRRQWISLRNSTPLLVYLTYCRCISFGGKGQDKDIKQALLGSQPKHFITFKKKMLFLSLPSFSYSLSFPSPWSFQLSFSLQTMKLSSMGK